MKGKRGAASGEGVSAGLPKTVYAGSGSNVIKSAMERKRGGAVKKDEGKVEGKMSKMRLDRPGRKKGGRVGADSAPLSSAAKVTPASGHMADGDRNC